MAVKIGKNFSITILPFEEMRLIGKQFGFKIKKKDFHF
jgi:hypothetical protein